jgi:hypothetical protein
VLIFIQNVWFDDFQPLNLYVPRSPKVVAGVRKI